MPSQIVRFVPGFSQLLDTQPYCIGRIDLSLFLPVQALTASSNQDGTSIASPAQPG